MVVLEEFNLTPQMIQYASVLSLGTMAMKCTSLAMHSNVIRELRNNSPIMKPEITKLCIKQVVNKLVTSTYYLEFSTCAGNT